MEPLAAGVALINALAEPARRRDAAQALALAWGCEEIALFIRDPQLGVLLPAPGMQKTFSGGALWRAFLASCASDGTYSAQVDLPAGSRRTATGLSLGGCVAVFFGSAPQPGPLERFSGVLPLLGGMLRAEQELAIDRAEAAEARDAASRAVTVVRALDAARAAAAALNEQLRQEHARKDEFLAMLAHELRNPLSALVNALEVLRRVSQPREAVGQRQFEVTSRQLRQLTHLVDDLLDVSRVNQGKVELRKEVLLLSEPLAQAVETVRPAMQSKGHQFLLQGAELPLYVNADRVRLVQIFTNLLQNAVKYTDAGGAIGVTVIPDGGRVCVVVRDTGLGIPPDMIANIFELFTQVPVGMDRAQGGLGIGLTLVKTLLQLHGGHVSAHSVGLGHGSTFTVSLPLVERTDRRQVDGRTRSSSSPADTGRNPDGAQAPPRPGAARVLVVDDNHDAADTLAEMLRFMGAEASIAHDAEQGISMARSLMPDLVLLDIGLPGMDGYEAARLLRAEHPTLHLIALTGYGSEKDRARAIAAGFDSHMVKPLDPALLEGLVRGRA